MNTRRKLKCSENMFCRILAECFAPLGEDSVNVILSQMPKVLTFFNLGSWHYYCTINHILSGDFADRFYLHS